MSLLDRLSGVDADNKIAVHSFFASMVLVSNGTLTQQQVKDEYGLNSGSDLTEWNAIVASYTAATDKNKWLETIHSIFLLAEQDRFDLRTKATANAAMQDAE